MLTEIKKLRSASSCLSSTILDPKPSILLASSAKYYGGEQAHAIVTIEGVMGGPF
jgi:hypothetical protein